MWIEVLRKNKKAIALHLLVIFLILSLIFLLITLYAQNNADRIQKSKTEIQEKDLVGAEKTILAKSVNGIINDVLFVADSLLLKDEYAAGLEVVKKLWIAFSDRMMFYDQIRYLDIDGNEVIRINNVLGYALAVDPALLQNKKDRYYFQDIITLQKSQIYISRLDLNVENDRIEQPIKPILRVGTPFFEEGELKGIILLNYAANDVLSQVKVLASSSLGDVYLLNSDGYWLYNGSDSSKEWAFMYDGWEDVSFAAEYPEEWEIINGSPSGYFSTRNGVYNYTSITPKEEVANIPGVSSILCKSGPIYIISYISSDSETGKLLSQDLTELLPKVLSRYAVAYPLVVVVAFILSVVLVVNKDQNTKIKYFSEFDAMTGVYNRRSGYGKLNELKKDISKRNCKIAVCFIDINGLKDINDHLGHDAGDELIQSVIGVIRDSIRGNDFVARLGGDEFLIVFDNLDEEGAENVWNRIVQKYTQINADENRRYVISVSHGIGMFRCSADESIDDVINRADAKMYDEKRKIKETLNVIRE